MSEVKLLDIEEIDQEVFTRWDITGHQVNRHLLSKALTGTEGVVLDQMTFPPGFVHHMHRHPYAATKAGFLRALRAYDQYRTLSSITATTVVISGGADRLTPPSHAHDLAHGIPGAMRVHRPAAGHMLLDEAPQVISNAIIGVISAHRTGEMKRRVMRNRDTPASRQPLASRTRERAGV